MHPAPMKARPLSPSPGLPLMEEEDIDSANRGHDPHQPSHVGGPGAQLAEVQPGRQDGRAQGPEWVGGRAWDRAFHSQPLPGTRTPQNPCPLWVHVWDVAPHRGHVERQRK